jgi:hypothetical protein
VPPINRPTYGVVGAGLSTRCLCKWPFYSLDQRPFDKSTAWSVIQMKVGAVPIQDVVGCWGELRYLLPKVIKPSAASQGPMAAGRKLSARDGESKTARALPRSQQDDIAVC